MCSLPWDSLWRRNNVNSGCGWFGALAVQRKQLTWQLLQSITLRNWAVGSMSLPLTDVSMLSSTWERRLVFYYSIAGFLLCTTYTTQWAFPSTGSGNWVAGVPAVARMLHPVPKVCCLYKRWDFIWLTFYYKFRNSDVVETCIHNQILINRMETNWQENTTKPKVPLLTLTSHFWLSTAIVMLYRQSERPASFHVHYVININSW